MRRQPSLPNCISLSRLRVASQFKPGTLDSGSSMPAADA
jgi:hypothetical protein